MVNINCCLFLLHIKHPIPLKLAVSDCSNTTTIICVSSATSVASALVVQFSLSPFLNGCWQLPTLKVKVAQLCLTFWDPMDYTTRGILQGTGVGSLSLLQEVIPTQGSNSGLPLPHCRRILYQLSHQGSPRILQWVAYPFSSRSSRPRNGTGVSCVASGFFTNWAIREAPSYLPSFKYSNLACLAPVPVGSWPTPSSSRRVNTFIF